MDTARTAPHARHRRTLRQHRAAAAAGARDGLAAVWSNPAGLPARVRYWQDTATEATAPVRTLLAAAADYRRRGIHAALAAQLAKLVKARRAAAAAELGESARILAQLAALLIASDRAERARSAALAPLGPPPDLTPALLIAAPGAPQLRACAPCL